MNTTAVPLTSKNNYTIKRLEKDLTHNKGILRYSDKGEVFVFFRSIKMWGFLLKVLHLLSLQ